MIYCFIINMHFFLHFRLACFHLIMLLKYQIPKVLVGVTQKLLLDLFKKKITLKKVFMITLKSTNNYNPLIYKYKFYIHVLVKHIISKYYNIIIYYFLEIPIMEPIKTVNNAEPNVPVLPPKPGTQVN